MIRQRHIDKYKEKSKFDDVKNMKQYEDQLLNSNRPLKMSTIRNLPKIKLYDFVDDIMTDKKSTRVLYETNARSEIKLYKNSRSMLNFKNNK